MNLYEIKTANLPLAKDTPLNPIEIYKVCKRMEITCRHAKGVGLAAVQVGIPWKLFVLCGQSPNNPLVKLGTTGYFVNCDYEGITADGLIVSSEGCLSIRSLDGQLRLFRVERFKTIQIKGLQLIENNDNLKLMNVDKKIRYDEDGVIYQHEADHGLPNRLISDIGKEIFVW
jgi:peptide deformylase